LEAARSRSTTAMSSAISLRLVLCAFSQPNFSHSAKLMFVSNQEQLRTFHHVAQKVLALLKFPGEFFLRIHGGIHLTPELSFRLLYGRNQIRKSHMVRDHHEIHIAFRSFCAARYGTKDERNRDTVRNGFQSLLQNLSGSECFAYESAEFLKYRTAMICLVVDLSALPGSNQYFGSLQSFELTLHGARTQPNALNDLFLQEPPVRLAEEQAQHALPGLSIECLADGAD
jgi:hypothetical protein